MQNDHDWQVEQLAECSMSEDINSEFSGRIVFDELQEAELMLDKQGGLIQSISTTCHPAREEVGLPSFVFVELLKPVWS